MSDSDHGTPFDEHCTDPIDAWSRAVFEACRHWPLARSGRWFRTAEGWLRLRFEQFDGEPLEPRFAIDVDTPDAHILVDCGSWATPIHPRHGELADGAAEAVAQASSTVESWLRGETRLVVYVDEAGRRSHRLVRDGSWPDAIEPAPVELEGFAKAVVKSPRRPEWRYFRRHGIRLWIEQSEGGDWA